MAGGKGERFWPASTPERPKQFIDVTGGGTLIQQTVYRLAQIIPYRGIYVLIGQNHLSLAQSQLPQIPASNFITEPVGRDTAPCIGLGAVWLEKVDPNALMLVVPADHYVPKVDRFCELASAALDYAARSGGLVTLGIRPDRAETGYGYIEVGEPCADTSGVAVYSVRRFVEKPDLGRAIDYVASGQFLWNSGIFAWSLQAIRREIARYLPALHAGLEELAAAPTRQEMTARLPSIFPRMPKMSIDYGVMERSDKVFVVPSDFAWDDLGTWSAIARLHIPDPDGNVLTGNVLAKDSQNMLVQSTGRLVATLGVSNLIVVETERAVLICARDRAQYIRSLSEALSVKSSQTFTRSTS